MTVNTTTNRVSYAGNGTTTAFAVPFPFLADADLVVIERTDSTGAEVTKTLTTHYTVSGAGGVSGTVTMVTAPATGVTLTIYRDPAVTQLVDLVPNDPLPVETAVEQPLDRLTMIAQRNRDLIDRALRLPDGDTGFAASDMKIPAKVTRASKYLAFDADGKPMAADPTGALSAVSPFMATVIDDADEVAAAATLKLSDTADAARGDALVGVNTSWGAATTLHDWLEGLKTGTSLQHTKWVLDNSVTGDSILEIVHGTSANPITTIEAKHSGIRVERHFNKTLGDSTTRATGVQGASLSCGLFEAFVTPGSQNAWPLRAGVFVGTPNSNADFSYPNHVAIYGEAQRTSGSDGVWALNTITEVTNLAGPTIGYEIDINNKSTVDPGVNPAQSFWGLSIVNGGEYRAGTGIVVNRNGSFSNNEWNRGIYIKEVLKIGLEIGNIWGGTSDAMLLGNQLANNKDTILLRRFTDTAVGGYFLRCVRRDDAANVIAWAAGAGKLSTNNPPTTAGMFNTQQAANGEDVILLFRNTDTTPTGQFLRCVNAANNVNLFQVNVDASGSDTVLNLSVAGAAAVTVSVGSNDSGGAGYRVLRVPN